MNCELFETLVDDYFENSLEESDRRSIEAHAHECIGCRKKLAWFSALIADSGSLRGSFMPQRNLWPDIARAIRNAPPGELQTLPVKGGSNLLLKKLLSGWPLAAVAAAAAVTVFMVTIRESDSRRSHSRNESSTMISQGLRPARSAGSITADGTAVSPQRRPTEPPGRQISSARISQACDCQASPEVQNLIEVAWKSEENLPIVEKNKLVSLRLYSLARQNGDEFFLHKASFDALFPEQPLALMERYRSKTGRADDPIMRYFYAYCLLGRNTPEMILLMEDLTSEYPSLPWTNLALADAYGRLRDEEQVKKYLGAFLRLCPGSPEAARFLGSVQDLDFIEGVTKQVRASLAARADTPSLLLYQNLWFQESRLTAERGPFNSSNEQLAADLARLRNMGQGRPPEFRAVVRHGYQLMPDQESFEALLANDQSYQARWQKVMLKIDRWLKENPVPADGAPSDEKARYWERRLGMADGWKDVLPEETRSWLERLRCLAELKNHADSEFVAAADKVVQLVRTCDQDWDPPKPRILTVASLYAKRGVQLDRAESLIREGTDRARSRAQQAGTSDLGLAPRLAPNTSELWISQAADEAWHVLLEANERAGNIDGARRCLKAISSGIIEARTQLTIARSLLNTVDKRWRAQVTAELSRDDSMIISREKQYADASLRLADRSR